MSESIRYKGDIYDVLLSHDGDHIVTKHNKRDPLHGYPVEHGGKTWVAVTRIAAVPPPVRKAQA